MRLEGEQLALSAASHWGEPRHVDAVRAVLASAGLDESALQTTPALPEDADARRAVVRGDGVARPIYHGCSGKHAAMLATCVAARAGMSSTYLEVDHPLQVALREYVEGVVGAPTAHTAVDGCGAPAWAMSLRALASGLPGRRPGRARDAVAATSRTRCVPTPSTCAVSSRRSPG